MDKNDVNSLLTRQQIADLLGVTVSSVFRLTKSKRMPVKPIYLFHICYYDKKQVLEWLAKSPTIRKCRNKTEEKKQGFVYDNHQRNIILFCNPQLLNSMKYE